MASYSGQKDDGELPVARELLKESAAFIENATITSDALHSQKKRIARSSKAAETTYQQSRTTRKTTTNTRSIFSPDAPWIWRENSRAATADMRSGTSPSWQWTPK
jgi:nucleoside phosphorylase